MRKDHFLQSDYVQFSAILLALGLLTLFSFKPELLIEYRPLPAPTPTPTPTPTPPLTLEQIIADELKKLAAGQIIFNPPQTMKQGKAERIEARITSQDIGGKLTEGLHGRGLPQTENIKVSNSMKVFLLGEPDEFHITKFGSDDEQIIAKPYTQWEWQVTPLSFGKQTLHLKASATINLGPYGEKSIDVPVIDKDIDVSISPIFITKTTLSNLGYWPYIFGGLGLPAIAGAIWRYLFVRKRRRAGFRP